MLIKPFKPLNINQDSEGHEIKREIGSSRFGKTRSYLFIYPQSEEFTPGQQIFDIRLVQDCVGVSANEIEFNLVDDLSVNRLYNYARIIHTFTGVVSYIDHPLLYLEKDKIKEVINDMTLYPMYSFSSGNIYNFMNSDLLVYNHKSKLLTNVNTYSNLGTLSYNNFNEKMLNGTEKEKIKAMYDVLMNKGIYNTYSMTLNKRILNDSNNFIAKYGEFDITNPLYPDAILRQRNSREKIDMLKGSYGGLFEGIILGKDILSIEGLSIKVVEYDNEKEKRNDKTREMIMRNSMLDGGSLSSTSQITIDAYSVMYELAIKWVGIAMKESHSHEIELLYSTIPMKSLSTTRQYDYDNGEYPMKEFVDSKYELSTSKIISVKSPFGKSLPIFYPNELASVRKSFDKMCNDTIFESFMKYHNILRYKIFLKDTPMKIFIKSIIRGYQENKITLTYSVNKSDIENTYITCDLYHNNAESSASTTMNFQQY